MKRKQAQGTQLAWQETAKLENIVITEVLDC
jgi:hypothetical protein